MIKIWGILKHLSIFCAIIPFLKSANITFYLDQTLAIKAKKYFLSLSVLQSFASQ